jgi:hypothetical protein
MPNVARSARTYERSSQSGGRSFTTVRIVSGARSRTLWVASFFWYMDAHILFLARGFVSQPKIRAVRNDFRRWPRRVVQQLVIDRRLQADSSDPFRQQHRYLAEAPTKPLRTMQSVPAALNAVTAETPLACCVHDCASSSDAAREWLHRNRDPT